MKKIAILLLISGCSFIDEPHYEIDSRLSVFVDTFFSEAESRGFYIKPENLAVRIDKLTGKVGVAKLGNKIPTIYIDTDYYNTFTQMAESSPERSQYFLRTIEMTVFHELGHALLGLDHIEKGGIMAIDTKEWHKYCENDADRTRMINDLFYEGR